MRDFFKSWKRKTGVVTLAMACAFMAGWVRSYFVYDLFSFPFGKFEYGCTSARGKVDFSRTVNHVELEWLFWTTVENATKEPLGEWTPWGDDQKTEWRWDWCGFHFGESKFDNVQALDYMIPYWSIVLPLTLLSAYLLINKPRPPKPKST